MRPLPGHMSSLGNGTKEPCFGKPCRTFKRSSSFALLSHSGKGLCEVSWPLLGGRGVVNGSSKQAAGHTESAHLPTVTSPPSMPSFTVRLSSSVLQFTLPFASSQDPAWLLPAAQSILFCFFKRFYSKLILKNKRINMLK